MHVNGWNDSNYRNHEFERRCLRSVLGGGLFRRFSPRLSDKDEDARRKIDMVLNDGRTVSARFRKHAPYYDLFKDDVTFTSEANGTSEWRSLLADPTDLFYYAFANDGKTAEITAYRLLDMRRTADGVLSGKIKAKDGYNKKTGYRFKCLNFNDFHLVNAVHVWCDYNHTQVPS